MNILLLSQWFDPEPGALRGLPLARWLQSRGHSVEVLTGFPNYPGGKIYTGYRQRMFHREEIEGISLLRVPLYPSHSTSAVGRLLNYGSFALSAATLGAARVRNADVVYAYHPPPTIALPAMVLKFLRQIPFVYHIADMWPESVTESGMVSNPKVKRLMESAIHGWCRWAYGGARAITVISPGFKKLLVQRGVPAEKIFVNYNWTEEDVFRPLDQDGELRAKLGIEDRFTVMYAGNLGLFQSVRTLLEAAKELRGNSDIQFVIVGTGQEEESLKAFAAQEGLTNVKFVGRMNYWEMPKVQALADLLLVHLKDLPFFTATIPSKTQVALASGRAILMGVRGDSSDIVANSGSGFLFEPEDPSSLRAAIEKGYAEGRVKLHERGRQGREYYMNTMSLERAGKQLEQIFQAVQERNPNAVSLLQAQC
jgi:colanic acid biosynthesis glycosyl transferase WcaI